VITRVASFNLLSAMSVLKIGADDVSDEIQRFKDRLSSKGKHHASYYETGINKLLDGEIANQQTNLMKQAIELKDLRGSLTEALRKVCAV